MTILYRTIPIETAEQAEALPVGSVAMSAQPGGGVWKKRTAESWVKASMTPSVWTNEGMANRDAALVALVPIEAEEETRIDSGIGGCETEQDFVDFLDGKRERTITRLVTPWENR